MEHLVWLVMGIFVATVIVNRVLAARDRIKGPEAREKVKEGALLLDVRTPGEYASGMLPGAKNIPVHELEKRIGELEKERPVIVYCRSGARSSSAKRILARSGYTVFDLGPARAY